jgi:hypothetical protein
VRWLIRQIDLQTNNTKQNLSRKDTQHAVLPLSARELSDSPSTHVWTINIAYLPIKRRAHQALRSDRQVKQGGPDVGPVRYPGRKLLLDAG